ncbi:hypothetical protein [Herpetosiphon giganteus]|uniref:hypothetical protein n=1 Tax=Herpetosiphon giganteus TaxID=2029754 RepID=UPI00195E1E03|nr:hypothetical protein [Herpetosiphon giganteus]MBM7843207.1 hypothetical protein [Herpetosiphon giganteus]
MRLRLFLLAISLISLIGFVVVQRNAKAQTMLETSFQAPVINCFANIEPMADDQTSSEVTDSGCEIIPAVDAISGEKQAIGHCVINIEPIDPSKAGQSSKVNSAICFATFQQAIEHATDGLVKLSADSSPELLDQTMLESAAAAKTTIIGIQWADPQYSIADGGLSQIWTTSQTAGCDGYNYGFATVEYGWNKQISSAKAFSNCRDFEHYEHANWTGLRIDCTQVCPGMGAMNNQTSSWRLDNVLP